MNPSIKHRRAFLSRVFGAALLACATMSLSALSGATIAMAAPADKSSPTANAAVHWNTVAGEAFAPGQATNPMAQSRTFAILHASIHDALNACSHS